MYGLRVHVIEVLQLKCWRRPGDVATAGRVDPALIPKRHYPCRARAGMAETRPTTMELSLPAPWGTRRDQGALRIIENVTGAPLTGNPRITDPEQVSIVAQIPTRLSVVYIGTLSHTTVPLMCPVLSITATTLYSESLPPGWKLPSLSTATRLNPPQNPPHPTSDLNVNCAQMPE
jgi:hypothetical protein